MTLVLVGKNLVFLGKRPSKIEVETSGFQEHIWKNMGATWAICVRIRDGPPPKSKKSHGFHFR